MRIVKLLLLFALVLTTSGGAFADTSFSGTWTGRWENSAGEFGEDSIVLEESADGSLSGDWAGMPIQGRREGDTIILTASTETRRYDAKGVLNDGVLTITYQATRLDSEGTYEGSSVLEQLSGHDCKDC